MSEVSRQRAASGAGLTGRTRSERILWDLLRTREPGWLAEVPTGQYRLDFFCPDLRLAVEVDGGSHWGERARRYDERRDAWHLQHGIRTVRVSAREVETDPAFVMRHIDEAVGRRRLEFAIMPPSKPPIWDLSDQPITPTKAIMSRRPRPASLRAPAERRPPSRSRRRGRQEPSWVVLGLGVLVVLAFFGNWFGAQDAYWDLSRRGADRVAGSLTDGLGAQPPIPRRVEGATACIGPTPACDQKLAVANAQLLADRMNLAVPAPPPPPDLRCGGRVSPVVIVTFQAAGATTVVEVLPGCHVFRTTSGEVRRATPGVIGQITAPGPA